MSGIYLITFFLPYIFLSIFSIEFVLHDYNRCNDETNLDSLLYIFNQNTKKHLIKYFFIIQTFY